MKNPLPLFTTLILPLLPALPVWAQQAAPIQLPPASQPEKQVLFDGSNLEHWTGMSGKGERQDRVWTVILDRMDVGGVKYMATAGDYGDCFLHLEWNPWAYFRSDKDLEGQGRGNSGVKMMNRYEVQILDSFQNETYADGMAGALYAQYAPRVNAARPPGQWQSFDILFHAPRFDDQGQLLAPARKTVFWNGVAVHHDRVLLGDEVEFEEDGREKKELKYVPHPPREPVTLQHHGSGVWFRDLWIQEIDANIDPREAALLRSRHAYALANREYSSKDRRRPQPPVIQPGLEGSPPSDALALILPALAQEWQRYEGSAKWRETHRGMVLEGQAASLRTFRNAQVHLEWQATDAAQTADSSGTVLLAGIELPLGDTSQTGAGWNTADILVSVHEWEHQGQPAARQRITIFCNNQFVQELSRHDSGESSDWTKETNWPLVINDPEGSLAFRRIWVRELNPKQNP